jgi:hypothetical protein
MLSIQRSVNINESYLGRLIVCLDPPNIPTSADGVPNSPFLSSVTNLATFDQQLAAYVQTSYVQTKYAMPVSLQYLLLTFADTKPCWVVAVSTSQIQPTFTHVSRPQ